MRIVITTLVLLVFFAQPNRLNPKATLNGGEVLPTHSIPMTCRAESYDSQIVSDEAGLEKLLRRVDRENCTDTKDLKIDFQKYSLIAVQAFADCHAGVTLRVERDAERKAYLVTITEKYGGCRGMDLHNRWCLVEKIPGDYKVQFKTIAIKERN